MADAVNTTATVTKAKTNADLANETKEALAKIEGSKTVKVSIPAILQPQLGAEQYVAINGVGIYVPVDGEDHSVPEPHALQLKEMLKNLK